MDNESAYRKVDLSKLNDITETLIRILPDSPPFYPYGNFRDLYGKHVARTVRNAQKHISKDIPFVEEPAGTLSKQRGLSNLKEPSFI